MPAIVVLAVLPLSGIAGCFLASRNRATARPAWSLAGVLALQIAWLVAFARQEDTSFASGDVSRWDFAGRDGHQWVVVVALVVSAASIGALAFGAATRKLGALRLGYGGTALSSILLFVSAFVLSVGH
jgi:hypothetical protein